MRTLIGDRRAVSLLLVSTLTIMSGATIAPSLPGIAAEFSNSPNSEFLTQMLLSLPALFIALFAPLAGMVADRFGRRSQLLFSVLLFAVAGTAGAQLDSLEAMLVSRAILGIAVAGIMTASTALIADYFSISTRTRFMGYQQAFSNIGGITFFISAGYLAAINTRLPFYIYGAAILLLPFLFMWITEPPKKLKPQQVADKTDTENRWVITLMACCVLIFCHFMVFYVMPTQLPFFMSHIGITDPSLLGLAMGMTTLTAALAALVFNRLLKVLKSHGLTAVGFMTVASGSMVLSVAHSFSYVVLASGLVGVGMGLILPNFMAHGMNVVPAHRRGLASGALTTSIFIGQFVSPLMSSFLIDSVGYRQTYLVIAVFLLVIAVFAFFLLKWLESISKPSHT